MNEKNNFFRVFVDSNVLISAMISKTSVSRKLLLLLVEEHQLIICSYSIAEVSRILNKRFPNKLPEWDQFLTRIEFELAYTPEDLSAVKVPYIRDPKDIPILISAMVAQPDILITGDLDFYTPEIQEYFTIMTPGDFLNAFSSNINQ
ncbi:putative toxin-antitoxin system toxin component, PIN family [Candidatus Desulfosporosinus infrequens]|uniref:Putative toxin-antitoxin system toxin component, PIN family n=1 Tax=Candidatus Desulfosporosinus infrequens TaxID=2043169 RepID=A0A2U3KPJ8_9FIRM|nr:putative toxin-antitoxin system toxin component, PIN family [Candidatus Desulfosporosinus infrequens]